MPCQPNFVATRSWNTAATLLKSSHTLIVQFVSVPGHAVLQVRSSNLPDSCGYVPAVPGQQLLYEHQHRKPAVRSAALSIVCAFSACHSTSSRSQQKHTCRHILCFNLAQICCSNVTQTRETQKKGFQTAGSHWTCGWCSQLDSDEGRCCGPARRA